MQQRRVFKGIIVNIILASSLLLVITACGKSGSSTPPAIKSSAKDISAFSFLKAANSIPVDATASISGTSISIFLPPGTNTHALKANFSVAANASVTVAGIAQTSGSTAVNFSNPVTYVVTAADGSKQSYTVTLTTDIASIDQTIASFMSTYNVPGLSLAITKNENLVYAKAYGVAATDLNGNIAASTQNLFRIASLSKQITAIAIMKLIDQGKLHLSDKVFGTGNILGTDYGTQPYGSNITNITIDHLLHHTAGGWPNDGSDPMFTNSSMTAGQLISWVLNNRPLTNTPGSNYAYSNFGYCVLGRVVEKITSLPYYDAVKLLVLTPCGVSDMEISGNTLADKIPNEVVYYGQGGENPYIYNISRMDSHGGWLASATSLAKILVHVDGFSTKPDILTAASITTMTTASTANANYACGWSVNNLNNWWHQGSLPGTATEQARTVSQGNYNFVILTNTRSPNANFTTDLDNLFWTALSKTNTWPSYDLF
jgi:CubicO group peptidase (beta-lactamase class C family)